MKVQKLYNHNYTPYSGQPAAAVVQSAKGHHFAGKRIENISYPLTVSAAQNALFCCISEGEQPQKLMVSKPIGPLIAYWKQEYNLKVSQLPEKSKASFDFKNITLPGSSSPLDLLKSLLDRAKVEESNFPVAAIAETKEGFVSGVNIECSAWNMGLCAERIAISKALTYTVSNINALHIHTRFGEFSSPCGACRQIISEHLPKKKIYLYHADGSQSVHFSNDLLPLSFQSSSLQNL